MTFCNKKQKKKRAAEDLGDEVIHEAETETTTEAETDAAPENKTANTK